MSNMNIIICRYHEIAIKGNNRNMFEKKLIDNMYHLLKEIDNLAILKIRGRIWIKHKDSSPFTDIENEILHKQLVKAFGLESYSPAVSCEPNMDKIKEMARETSIPIFQKALDAKGNISFRVRARRSDKEFPLNSKEIEIELAKTVGTPHDYDSLSVDLVNADVTVGCEVRKEQAFIFFETFRGPGGLPTGSNAPVLALISGGIDSPVACYLSMKRGCPVEFITFHSSPYTPPESVEKVKRIVKRINKFQVPRKFHICNLAPIQKLIRDECNPRFRTVLYRRMMFRISEKVARRRKCLGLVTGEVVGQVASQTITNMGTIDNAVNMLVLRPLLGMDKNEVIKVAEKIDTFEISKEQVPDSCTVFAPASPATKARVDQAVEEEQKLGDYDSVLNKIIDDIEVIIE